MSNNMSEVIIERIKGLECLFNEKFNENDKTNARIESQVKYTNGRVRLLEKFIWALWWAITFMAFCIGSL